jgi:deoxyribonuclease-4
MKPVGAHVSAAGGVAHAVGNALAIGADAFALFTRNQRQWTSPPLAAAEVAAFRDALAASGIRPEHILPHDSYLINLGNPDPDKRRKSRDAFLDEARRVEQLGLTMLNFHPGSHLKEIEEDACLQLIAAELKTVLAETEHVILVAENTAGQGSNLGYRFEHLARLAGLLGGSDRFGVCLDTCHTAAAGYELATDEGYDKTMAEFGRIVGFPLLRGMHLNDMKGTTGSRLDRHAPLGEGTLGLAPFRRIMADPRLDGIPLILETPDETKEMSLWKKEIELLRAFAG